jgi:hypothetical protein
MLYDVVIPKEWGVVTVGDTIGARVLQARLLIEAIPASGSELTSGRLNMTSDNVLEAFDRAKGAIVEVASPAVDLIGKAAARGACPDRLEIESGAGFSAQGDLIVVGVGAHARLLVRLVYDGADRPD